LTSVARIKQMRTLLHSGLTTYCAAVMMATMLTSAPIGAVVAAAASSFVIGGLWFSPLVFGRVWLRELHASELPQSRAVGALLAIPASLGAAFGLGVLIASTHADTLWRGIVLASLVWLAFAVAIHLPAAYLEHAPRRFAIDIGHQLVVFLTMGSILGAWH